MAKKPKITEQLFIQEPPRGYKTPKGNAQPILDPMFANTDTSNLEAPKDGLEVDFSNEPTQEQKTQQNLLLGAAGVGGGAKAVSSAVADPMFQRGVNGLAGSLPTGGLLEGAKAVTNNMAQGAGNVATNLGSPMFHAGNAIAAVAGNTAGDIYKDYVDPKNANSEIAVGKSMFIEATKNAKSNEALPDNTPEEAKIKAEAAKKVYEDKKDAVDKMARGTGKHLADNATGGNYPKKVMDFAVKPTLDAIGEGISTIAKKTGEVTDSVTESKLGQILGSILGGAGKVAKEAISMTAYGLPLDLASKGLGYIGEGLDKTMGTNIADSIPSIGQSSFVPATLETYSAEKAKLSPEQIAVLKQPQFKTKELALPELNKMLQEVYNKKPVAPVSAPANIPNKFPVATSNAKPGMLSQLGSALSMSPEQQKNTDTFFKNHDKGYWDTVIGRSIGQKDPGLPRLMNQDDVQEQRNQRAANGRKIQLFNEWYKLSKPNIDVNQNMNELIGLFAQNSKPSDSALLYAMAKASDRAGRVTDADIDNYKKYGTDATGMLKEWFAKYVSPQGTLLPQHKKELVDVAFSNWKSAVKVQGQQRLNFITHAVTTGVGPEDAKAIVELDNYGPLNSDMNEMVKIKEDQIKLIYGKLGGGSGDGITGRAKSLVQADISAWVRDKNAIDPAEYASHLAELNAELAVAK